MVWPTRVRRRAQKHEFERALDEARLDPDGGGPLFDEPMQFGPAVGSLGGIAVASGYVAPASLARAYGADEGPAEPHPSPQPPPPQPSPTLSRPPPSPSPAPRPVERPGEAARKLKAALVGREHTVGDLKRLRRGFAAQNHPDKVSHELRDEALAAMSEVNAEIDRALKRAKRS